MIEVAVTELDRHELKFAAGVVGRGFRDNPMTIAAFGEDSMLRMRGMERVMSSYTAMLKQPPLAARRGDWVVGVCGLAPPETCQLPFLQQLRFMTTMMRCGPAATVRCIRIQLGWKKRDPGERHWHLGPVAVEPGLQGMSVGSQMLERFCVYMDDLGEMAHLETDKPENVRFYERFGFVTVEEAELLGYPNWFMRRTPVQR
jgi:ribosomal protein S18 acetylase RimI-like enzyme